MWTVPNRAKGVQPLPVCLEGGKSVPGTGGKSCQTLFLSLNILDLLWGICYSFLFFLFFSLQVGMSMYACHTIVFWKHITCLISQVHTGEEFSFWWVILESHPCLIQVIFGWDFGSDHKESACNAGDLGSITGLGRSPGEGNGYPHQYSCLENSMDRGAWQATVHGIAKSWTQLSNLHFHFQRLKTDKVFRCLWLCNYHVTIFYLRVKLYTYILFSAS